MKGVGYMNITEQIKKQAIHVSLKLGATANDYNMLHGLKGMGFMYNTNE